MDYGVRLAAASSQVNLTRILDGRGMAVRHFLDTYHLLPVLKEVNGPVLDMGTGGGVPGLVLAILRKDLRVVMIDGTGKKVRFLQDWIMELKIKNATALHARVEEHLRRHRYAVGISRAAIKPAALMEYLMRTGPALKRIVFLEGSRGKEKAQEIMPLARKAGYAFDMAMPYQLPGLDRERYLVCFKRRR